MPVPCRLCCTLVTVFILLAVAAPHAKAESGQVFGIHFWDWGANVDVMSHQTGWVVEANAIHNAGGPNVGGRYMPAAAEGFTILQRLDYEWEQTIPLTPSEQDTFASECASWANQIKHLCRHYSIGNEVEFFDVTPQIYADCFVKVRNAIKAVQPEARVIIGHMNSIDNQYQVMQLLGPNGYDGVTAHSGSHVPTDLADRLDQAGALAGVGIYITEWGWVAGTNADAMAVMQQFAQDIGNWNASNDRQVYCACWYLYPYFLDPGYPSNPPTFSLQASPLDNAAFENATTLGQARNIYADNPVIISDLVADIPEAGQTIPLSWTTNVPTREQVWWTPEGMSGWQYEEFTQLDTTLTSAHDYTISGLTPGTVYEVMPNCTRDDHGDAGGRRYRVKTGPWPSQAQQIPAPTLTVEITWNTDWPADSRVDFGRSASLGSTQLDSTPTTNHSVQLSGLGTGLYYYQVLSSEDPVGFTNPARLYMRSELRWFNVEGEAPGDYDGDGDVDDDDYTGFVGCYSGPAGSPGFQTPSSACLDAFDFESDGDVDCDDWHNFTIAWTGPPQCPPAFTTCEADCDGTGRLDTCEIAEGLADDCNGNSVPDGCEPDDDGDGVINACDECPATIPGVVVDEVGCPIPLSADFDRDGDVDSADFGHFQVCLTGTGVLVTDEDCLGADIDGDEDVDSEDFDIFHSCMSGANIPGDPACSQP